jgi:hypothetical protein
VSSTLLRISWAVKWYVQVRDILSEIRVLISSLGNPDSAVVDLTHGERWTLMTNLEVRDKDKEDTTPLPNTISSNTTPQISITSNTALNPNIQATSPLSQATTRATKLLPRMTTIKVIKLLLPNSTISRVDMTLDLAMVSSSSSTAAGRNTVKDLRVDMVDHPLNSVDRGTTKAKGSGAKEDTSTISLLLITEADGVLPVVPDKHKQRLRP